MVFDCQKSAMEHCVDHVQKTSKVATSMVQAAVMQRVTLVGDKDALN